MVHNYKFTTQKLKLGVGRRRRERRSIVWYRYIYRLRLTRGGPAPPTGSSRLRRVVFIGIFLLSACGRCSFGGLVVRVCVPVSGVFSLSVCPVCV